jgi:hypothetical protein
VCAAGDTKQPEDTVVKSFMRMMILTPALAILVPATAQAADPGFCREYATAAVRQVELAKSVAACNRGVGARWTAEYRVHFDWCLGAAPGAVEAERTARTNWIRSCRGS